MGNGSAKYTPYLRTVVFQFEEQSGVFNRAGGLGQEVTIETVPLPGVLRQEFNILAQEIETSGVLGQEFNMPEASGILGQEFTISGIDDTDDLGQEFNVSGILSSGDLSQEFTLVTIGSGTLGQEYNIEFYDSGILGQEFTIPYIPDSGNLSQEFGITTVGSGTLGQEYTIYFEASGLLSQEYTLSGTFDGSESLGQQFTIASIDDEATFGNEFQTTASGEDHLQQEFTAVAEAELGQEVTVSITLPDPGTVISGVVQKIFEEPELTADIDIEGPTPGEDPQAGHSGVNIILSNVDTDQSVPYIEWMLGVNDPSMPLRASGTLGWDTEAEHFFDLGAPLEEGDCIYYAARLGDGEGGDSDLIQMIPPIFLDETVSGVYCVPLGGSTTEYLGQEFEVKVGQFYPQSTTIRLGGRNSVSRVIVWDEGDDGNIHAYYVRVAEDDTTYASGCHLIHTKSIDELTIDPDEFQKYSTTVCRRRGKNQLERFAFVTKDD